MPSVDLLQSLLDPKKLEIFYSDIAFGKYPVPEIEEILHIYRGSRERLAKVLRDIAKLLFTNNREFIYPLEFIVVPRYPFSKTPMIEWSRLRGRDPSDYEVNSIKYLCSRLGKLINTAIVMRNIALIDIDGKPSEVRSYADVETRRGFHIVRYISNYEALKICGTTKRVFHGGDVRVEVMSGPLYLWSYPPQSRYLEYADGKLNVRCYKVLSKELEQVIASGDVEPIMTSPEGFKHLLSDVLRALGMESYASKLDVEPVAKIDSEVRVPSDVSPRESRFNRNPLGVLGAFGYDELKNELSNHISRLPTCLRHALFGSPKKGSRYFHLRLLLAVVPFFVSLDQENLRKLIEDFSTRTGSKPSEVREWTYDTKYFTGRVEVGDTKIHVPSRLGVPAESWSFFETAGYCDECPLSPSCRKLEYSKRRRLIVSYIADLLEGRA